MLRLSKQANDEIRRLEESRNRNIMEEREKRQITENQDAIEFWIATARHWHKRAKFLEGVADRERDNTTHAVTEMEIQSIERHHWKQCAEQNHGDVMAAEARTDAMGDILDALARGWRMESYDGCAKWWRYDTDTLQALAKEAREWEQTEDSKPLTQIYIGKGEGEPFTMGDQHFVPLDEPTHNDDLIKLANHMRGSMDGLPEEWQQWAAEIEQSIRKSAFTTATKVADVASKALAMVEGKAAQQAESVTESKADGFNGHMIGTDGDRVGFIWHAAKYGFKSEYNPESATSAQIEDDYNRAFTYMQANCYPLKPQ